MNLTPRRTYLAALGVGVTILFVVCIPSSTVADPKCGGKKVSTWFRQLCTGVFTNARRKNVGEAYDAFSKMGPEAAPYLISQLFVDRTGQKEKILIWLQVNTSTTWLSKNVVFPSSRRQYAVTALGAMGSAAQSAIPDLMRVWKWDVAGRPNSICAISKILYAMSRKTYLQMPAAMSSSEYQRFEDVVISEAAARCPETARELQIKVAVDRVVAEPSAGGNSE